MNIIWRIITIIPGILLQSEISLGQVLYPDPLLNMVNKMYFIDRLSYNSVIWQKSLFDLDTACLKAKVSFQKYQDSIIWLYIEDQQAPEGLLFNDDSCWFINRMESNMEFIGTGPEAMSGNMLSQHFPGTIFTVDTLINRLDPYWKVIGRVGNYDRVTIDITEKPEEVSDLNVELLISKGDSLVHGVIRDAGFKGVGYRYFQKQSLKDYTFPSTAETIHLQYLNDYMKIIPHQFDGQNEQDTMQHKKDDEEDYFPDKPGLVDLEGNPFKLPSDNIIFLDFWYAGCFPCMKAAPVIESLYQEFKDSVYFFSVNDIDRDTAKIKRFKKSLGISFPVLITENEKISNNVGSEGSYPFFILINAINRMVLWKGEGYSKDLEEKIRRVIHENL